METAADGTPGDPLLGTVVGERYKVVRRVGEGGMGAVYLAEHTTLRKRVALKFLHAEMSRVPDVVARFTREAIAAAALEHPNIVAAHDFGQIADGRFFLVLDFVEGRSLRDLLDHEKPLPPPRALHITTHIAAALQRAHGLGIVHRDLKPENIMLVERDADTDFARVIDFGIAKVSTGTLGETGPALTQAGVIFGTPDYMAPEQCLGAEVDARADLYSLAVMVFEMLTGRRPYVEDDVMTLLARHLSAPVPSLRETSPEAALPFALDAVFARALAKSPRDRFASARAFVDALAEALAAPPAPPSPPDPPSPPETPAPSEARAVAAPETAPASAATDLALGRVVPRPTPVPAVTAPRGPVAPPAWAAQALQRLPRSPAARASLGLAAVLLGALGLRALTSSHETSSSPAAPASSPRPSAVSPTVVSPDAPTPPRPRSLDARVAAFRARPEVIDALDATPRGRLKLSIVQGLVEQHRGDAAAQYVLGLALARQHAPDALACLQRAVTLEPAFAQDDALVTEVVRMFSVAPSPDAEAMVRGALARTAFPKLLEVATGRAAGRTRAVELLQQPPFEPWMDATTRGILALGEARGCDDRRAAIEALGRDGDARALPHLARINIGTGCGFLGLAHCNTCLASALPTAIRAIRQRTAGARDE